MASRIRRHTQILTFKIWWFYESIHLRQSKFYGNLPFTILMTLQQSVVAERGREPGGFPSERAESILLGKGAKSVVVMPDSIFLGHRYSRTAPPRHISRDTESYSQPSANEYPCRQRGLSLMVWCVIKIGTGRKTLLKVLSSQHQGITEMIKSDVSTITWCFFFL